MLKKGLIGYLPVNIAQAIAGFGSIFLFTRLLSPESYGAYALAFAVSALASLALLTWIEAAMARFYAAETSTEGQSDLFASLYAAFGLAALLVLGLGVGAALIAPVSAELRRALACALVSVVLRSCLKLAQERRRAAGEVAGFAAIDLVQTSLGFGLGVVLALKGLGAAAPFIGQATATALCALVACPPEVRRALKGRVRPQRLSAAAAYGVPVALSLIMGMALSSTDRFVLAADMDAGGVGAYHAGYMLSSRTLDILFLWLGMAGQPACIAALERGGRGELHRVARDQAALMALLSVPAAAGLALIAGPLTHVMIGTQIADRAAGVTPWIALSAALAGATTHYLNTAFTLARLTGRLFLALAAPALLNLVLVLILVPRYGLGGAAGATVASYAAGVVISLLLTPKAVRLPLPLEDIAKALLAAGVMSLVVSALPAVGGIVEIACKSTVGACVYGLCALILNAGGVRQRLLARAPLLALQGRGA